jgi:hypothetical protein
MELGLAIILRCINCRVPDVQMYGAMLGLTRYSHTQA